MVDCIEEYILKNGSLITVYRTRIYSAYLQTMVSISGDKGLHATAQGAINYGYKWLAGNI